MWSLIIKLMNGTTSMKDRQKIRRDFEKADAGFLCVAKVLNEGVDVPVIDTVVLLSAYTILPTPHLP